MHSFQLQHGLVVHMLFQHYKAQKQELVQQVHGLLCNQLVVKNMLTSANDVLMQLFNWLNKLIKYLNYRYVETQILTSFVLRVKLKVLMFIQYIKY